MDAKIDIAEKVTGRQLRAARALLGWSRTECAAQCSVSVATLARLEGGEEVVNERMVTHVVRAFRSHGIEFHEDERGIGVSFLQAI